jgi:hypothetical protein
MHTFRGHTQRVSRHSKAGRRVFALSGLGALVASTVCALAMEHPAQAAVFTIQAGDVAALIEAINTANNNGEDDTIHLAAGTYTLTAVDNDALGFGPTGLPTITSTITINGEGAEATRIVRDVTGPLFRIIGIGDAGVLTLDGVTIAGGNIDGSGGGIISFGALTLKNSVVSGNSGRLTWLTWISFHISCPGSASCS